LIVDKQSDSAISKHKFKTGEVMLDIKKILPLLGILVLAFLIFGVLELSAAPRKHIIVIDPAHGGQDTGIKLTDKVDEKDITLAVALALRKELAKENNLEIILTRDSDKEVSLEDRKKNIAKIKPDFVLSLHTNAGFGKSASGFELYCPEFNNDFKKEKKTAKGDARQEKNKYLNDSVRLARSIQENLNTLFPRKGRGLRRADLPITEDLFVPAVVVEMSFATNPEDKKKLLSPNTQTEIANALAKSIKSFYR
jgi:N-acetylmuramoyl-L-alanine amidase